MTRWNNLDKRNREKFARGAPESDVAQATQRRTTLMDEGVTCLASIAGAHTPPLYKECH